LRDRYQSGRVSSAIINCLRQREGGWVTHSELLDYIYQGDEPELADEVLRVTVSRLRKQGFPIATHAGKRRPGLGYRFAPTQWEWTAECQTNSLNIAA
jgi:DNA-binding response OmpR family regulator